MSRREFISLLVGAAAARLRPARAQRSQSVRRIGVLIHSAIVATALAGCAASGDRAGEFFVTPDRYVLYNCPQLAKAAQSTVSRQRKLEILMAKAEVDSVGVLVSRTTYGPEYAQLSAMMNQLHKAAADKNCKLVPGAENSDGVVENQPSANEPSIYGLPGGLH